MLKFNDLPYAVIHFKSYAISKITGCQHKLKPPN